MNVIVLDGDAAAALRERLAQQERDLRAFMLAHGVTGAEAVVMDDPPVSDVDAE